MASTKISLQEDNILKLVLELLSSRKLYKATRALEKEANVVNCPYSDSIKFLRELVLDGEWEAVEDFAQPLEEIQEFDCRKFHFLVTKQKYLETLFEKCESNVEDKQALRDSLVACLNLLEKYSPLKDEYNKLYWYLSVPSLRDEPEFSNWNVDLSRMVLFEEIVTLLKAFIPVNEKNLSSKDVATEDRLLSLLSKGLLYENCIDFCQKQAMHRTSASDFSVTNVQTDFFRAQSPHSSGNFYSWLHSLPPETFVTPFEQLSIKVEVEKPRQTRALLNMKNNSLSRSLTFESRTPTKNLFPGSVRVEKKRLSDGQARYGKFDFNSRDVSQSWADFDMIGTTSDKQRIPVIGEEDTFPGKVKEDQLDDEDQFKTILSPRKMRNNQQETVLQRLEEHKKRQQELHRQLAEMTASLAIEDGKEAWGEKDAGVLSNGVASNDTFSSSKSSEVLRKSKESFRFLNEGYKSPKVDMNTSNDSANAMPMKELGDNEANTKALVNDHSHLVSPQTSSSSRPKRISIPDEAHIEVLATALPKTPVNRILPPGLVNLSDGSGTFNTRYV